MAWTAPKTNWTPTDYFNASDYNRIKTNIEHCATMPETAISISPMGITKSTGDPIYASEINKFEQNVSTLCEYIGETYGAWPTNYPNGPIIRWKELNRIEKALYRVYVVLFGTTPLYAIDSNGAYAVSDNTKAKARA